MHISDTERIKYHRSRVEETGFISYNFGFMEEAGKTT